MLTPHELHEELAEELEISFDQNVQPHQLLKLIYSRMVSLRSRGKQIVLLIDGSEYKRKQAAPCLRVTGKDFGRGRRFPIVERFRR